MLLVSRFPVVVVSAHCFVCGPTWFVCDCICGVFLVILSPLRRTVSFLCVVLHVCVRARIENHECGCGDC